MEGQQKNLSDLKDDLSLSFRELTLLGHIHKANFPFD